MTKVTHIMIPFLDRVENFVENGENAGYHHFVQFQQCFRKASFQGFRKFALCGNELSGAGKPRYHRQFL